jgi:predicted ATPase
MRWEKVESRSGYPWSLPLFAGFERLDLAAGATFFVGENGSGKSTLLEGIAEAYGMNSEGGGRNFNFNTTSHRSPVAAALRLVRSHRRPRTDFFLRAESMYNIISEYERMIEDREPLHYLHKRSHGEGFLELLKRRFGADGFYMMDEPESALSPQNQLTLLCHMANLIKEGCQFVIATHSPILLAFPGATIIQFTAEGMRPIAYRETEHYLITRRVLADPEGFMEKLLGDPPRPS